MGIDPQTHQPSTSSGPNRKPPAPPSTRHMAQWESARLEAEARLSKESLFLNPPPSSGTPSSDYFLRIWNSEVGESFRNVNKTSCQSPVFSQASSSAKCGSVSGTTTEIGVTLFGSNQNEDMEFKSGNVDTDNVMDSSDSSSSNELDDLSDTALQLLFDFPGNHDMSFLEHDDNYAFMSCHIWLKQPSLYCMVLMLEPLPAVFAAGIFLLPAANYVELEPNVTSFVVGFKFVAYMEDASNWWSFVPMNYVR